MDHFQDFPFGLLDLAGTLTSNFSYCWEREIKQFFSIVDKVAEANKCILSQAEFVFYLGTTHLSQLGAEIYIDII